MAIKRLSRQTRLEVLVADLWHSLPTLVATQATPHSGVDLTRAERLAACLLATLAGAVAVAATASLAFGELDHPASQWIFVGALSSGLAAVGCIIAVARRSEDHSMYIERFEDELALAFLALEEFARHFDDARGAGASVVHLDDCERLLNRVLLNFPPVSASVIRKWREAAASGGAPWHAGGAAPNVGLPREVEVLP